MEKVSKEKMQKINNSESWVGFFQDNSPTKLNAFDYKRFEKNTDGYFGVNLNNYEKGIMKKCFELSN